MCESLIAAGHKTPGQYTPRALNAFLMMANDRRKSEMLSLFNLHRTAYHGDDKAAKKVEKELGGGNG